MPYIIRVVIVVLIGIVYAVLSIEGTRLGRLRSPEGFVMFVMSCLVIRLGLSLKPMPEDEEGDDG